MTQPIIYHGTPMTPRAALQQMSGRAFCVSFYRPDDVEVVQQISPAIMFRQRSVFILAASLAKWQRMGGRKGLDAILQMAGATHFGWSLGCHSRYASGSFADKRWLVERLAFWTGWRSTLAHGWAYSSVAAFMRKIRTGMLGLDWARARQNSWLRSMVSADGRSCIGYGKPVAHSSHDAGRHGCAGISISQRGQHQLGAERSFI